MVISPISAIQQGLVEAYLEILQPEVEEPIIPFCFNPTEYKISKSNNFAEIAIPGLESPALQFVHGAAETLSAELVFDTSNSLEDVREVYTSKLRDLMRLEAELHAPPILRFVWDTQIFIGVLESLDTSYLLFSRDGVPIRASMAITLKEYRLPEDQIREIHKLSPDFEKAHRVRAGETLSSIAAAVYRDASLWREIATANSIQDPRRLEPGVMLVLPRLR